MTRCLSCCLFVVFVASILGCGGNEKTDVPSVPVIPPKEKPTILSNMPGDAKK